MQGQISGKGHLFGAINPTGNLQGTMSTEALVGGQVVGMRGLKGDKGETGETGNGIANAVLNADYTLTLTFTDGTIYTTPSIRGEKGEDGIIGRDGVGIESIEKTSTIGLVDTYTITLTDGTTTTFEVTNGKDGEDGYTPQKGVDYFDGQDGTDGISPSASVSKVGKTSTFTVTDKDGTTSVNILDGNDGTDGADGEDGFSPSATVSKVGDTATITITDKDGTTTAQVTDGEDGASDWSDITNKPETFPPSTHNHTKSEITDFAHTHTKSNITDFAHNHTKSEITDFAHNHDDRYYTEAEVDEKLVDAGKVTDVQLDGVSVVVGKIANLVGLANKSYVDDGLDAKPDEAPSDNKQYVRKNGAWEEVDVTTKEDVANKVTTISASSTDVQYPSAKAVYDSKTLVSINRWEVGD